MRRPDFWNWPPFMTVTRHNRIVTEIIAQAQVAIDQEHGRATREGRAMVHAWAVEANHNVFYSDDSPAYAPKAYAAFQQAEHQFRPDRLNLSEVLDNAPASSAR